MSTTSRPNTSCNHVEIRHDPTNAATHEETMRCTDCRMTVAEIVSDLLHFRETVELIAEGFAADERDCARRALDSKASPRT